MDCVNGFNKAGALLGLILNHLQPVVLLIIALLANKNKTNKSRNILLYMYIFT